MIKTDMVLLLETYLENKFKTYRKKSNEKLKLYIQEREDDFIINIGIRYGIKKFYGYQSHFYVPKNYESSRMSIVIDNLYIYFIKSFNKYRRLKVKK